MPDTLLKVEGLHKKFCQSLKRSMLYGTIDAAKSMFGFPIENVDLRKNEFWALQDINLELKRGETVGIIGQNGCGKTTLLRLINGIFPPDKGNIEVNGRVGALIAVGAGFHPQMTGRENIYLNGTILGMTKTELKRKFNSIVDFAEIGNFIDSPVANYSSGMNVRLGFAIAIHCEPDVLLLDEILAVGDSSFQGKCFNKIFELQNSGVGILLVSHNDQVIYDRCNKAMLIDGGRTIALGSVSEAMFKYNQILIEKNLKNLSTISLEIGAEQNNPMKLNLSIENSINQKVESINPRDSFYIVVEIDSEYDLENLLWVISLTSKDNNRILYLYSKDYNIPMIKIKKGKTRLKVFIKNLSLLPGVYSLSTGFTNISNEKPFLNIKPIVFNVNGMKHSSALFDVDVVWEI
jgi:lipopolysaccharide transport system ATP-binding protein